MSLTPDRFPEFFSALYGYPPFPWQTRLAEQAAEGRWPDCIAVPTASGKTACIDIAVFALACQTGRQTDRPAAPRRIFFVVDRRVIVDEAYGRAKALANALAAAPGGILAEVAGALRAQSRDSDAPPLDTYQLRGGIYRDDAWVRSPLQPTVIASTVDQLGSRLLFRGYGVSDNAKPIHAGLIGNDSLIVLDEAHCAQPFRETLHAVARYRGEKWAEAPLGMPFQFVEMSATPREETQAFRLDAADIAHPVLSARRAASKPAGLLVAKGAKGKNTLPKLAKTLQAEAERIANSEANPQSIAIIVNRVRTAKLLHEALAKKHGDRVHLMIGRMRAIDRGMLTDQLQNLFRSRTSSEEPAGTAPPPQTALPGFEEQQAQPAPRAGKPRFVIATQCLEVGADFDFDAMVCECASLDALRQRFGRLNRMGRPIEAQAAVVIAEGDTNIDPKKPDPIYGASLPETWQWLNEHADQEGVDFGNAAMDTMLEDALAGDPELLDRLQPPAPHAPVMLPAHLDCWCQTSPMPAPDPDVSIFLHGPRRGQPEVQICWRADLAEDGDPESWTQAVSLCPPVSSECLATPVWLLRQWLFSEETAADALSDVLGGSVEEEEATANTPRPALIWRGPTESRQVREARDIRVGDTIVLPASAGGWDIFGHIPNAPAPPSEENPLSREERARLDLGDRAFREYRGKVILRLHPAVWSADPALDSLREWAANTEDERTLTELRTMLAAAAKEAQNEELANTLRELARQENGLIVDRYLDTGAVLRTRRRIRSHTAEAFLDDRDDSTSTSERSRPVLLAEHLAGVAAWAKCFGDNLGDLTDAVTLAGRFHDLGKADPRFQAYLRQSTMPDAQLWAKHPKAPASYEEHRRACERSGRPDGWRHELLSVALLQERLEPNVPHQDLLIHLLGAHHGYCRPFAPCTTDPEPVEISVQVDGTDTHGPADTLLTANSNPRLERLDSGVPERFWQLTRRHGWWGLPYLEALVRLADWRRSADENRGLPAPAISLPDPHACIKPASQPATAPASELLLAGIDGANPLGFLAALGTLRTLAHAWPDRNVRMSWRQHAGAWRPVLHAHSELTPEATVLALASQLEDWGDLRAFDLGDNLGVAPEDFRTFVLEAVQQLDTDDNPTREWVDFIAAFGCESILAKDNQKTKIEDTALRTMGGGGNQHFLKFCRDIRAATEPDHLRKSLLHPWDYSDPGRGLHLRWDPESDRRYALRWKDPGADAAFTMRGANRLAIEAMPLLPAVPSAGRLETTGFRSDARRHIYLCWPIWTVPINLDTCRSLLAIAPATEHKKSTDAAGLRARGIDHVNQSQRLTVGKYRNFAPSNVR